MSDFVFRVRNVAPAFACLACFSDPISQFSVSDSVAGADAGSSGGLEGDVDTSEDDCLAGMLGCPCRQVGEACESGLVCVSALCEWPGGTCGDAALDLGEECDDGNLVDDDGCDSTCANSGIVEIVAGESYTCALTRAGSVKCWGRNGRGQLGQGHTQMLGDNELVAAIPFVDLGDKAVDIAGGREHACAVLVSGQAICWGRGDSGQLGTGSPESVGDDETPAVAGRVLLAQPVTTLGLGAYHSCAVLDRGPLCWGSAGLQLGIGFGGTNVGDDEPPSDLEPLLVPATRAVAGGALHTCATTHAGQTLCWGHNNDGRLGIGSTVDQPLASAAVPVELPEVEEVAVGEAHACARLSDGQVRCWGNGAYGALGYGATGNVGDDEVPASPVAIGGAATRVACGRRHSCAILEGGNVRCWGDGSFGKLGYGDIESIGDDEVPVEAESLDFGRVAVGLAAGFDHTCVIFEDGSVVCWGRGEFGALGTGTGEDLGDDERASELESFDIFK